MFFYQKKLGEVNHLVASACLEYPVMVRIIQPYKPHQDQFCEKALQKGARLTHIPHISDPHLTTDVAILGDDNAPNVVIITSGLHGVELPAGSIGQQILLDKLTDKHLADTRYIFVHALNPYGAHHALRTDLGEAGGRNIDPARNFVDFNAAEFKSGEAVGAANAAIASAFEKATLSNHSLSMMWGRLLYTAFVQQGQAEFKRTFVQGQYTNPLLPYYGGTAASCTRLTWEKIVNEYILDPQHKPHIKTIYHFDIHTGDGPFGTLQLYLCKDAGEQGKAFAENLIEADKIKVTDDYFAKVTGDIGDYWQSFDLPKEAQIIPITMEFGTTQARIPGIDVLGAILNRTLLAEKYEDTHHEKEEIIQKMRTAFTPTQDNWAYAVITQSHDLWDRFLKQT